MKEKPSPWYCPRCRNREVRRRVVCWEGERVALGQTVHVTVPCLSLPVCDACGERVFDDIADQQIRHHTLAYSVEGTQDGHVVIRHRDGARAHFVTAEEADAACKSLCRGNRQETSLEWGGSRDHFADTSPPDTGR